MVVVESALWKGLSHWREVQLRSALACGTMKPRTVKSMMFVVGQGPRAQAEVVEPKDQTGDRMEDSSVESYGDSYGDLCVDLCVGRSAL